MTNIKDIVLAILVAYVVLDIALTFMLKRARPLLVKEVMNVGKKERKAVFISVILAILAGAGTFYMIK